ncbi:cobalamin biosynthesis protein CobW [Pseudonocardia sp. EC080610-09]|uniref:ribosome hibernation factor-recruiting GTPase MRF n=1 Tax=unclassified Pseudonocardia TaxID=2619320 RepID=UPI0006CB5963|nr:MULTISPECIES: GTP-binding protein [unclassified Pseudonocardia]ALE72140.1 cobalamin biosynthesis protein CobW [Pseudonocardia sp. EC080625-04]ALL75425.1 cobalamin biosynthesis protein CobW [Pseudonocardia sp. EC080610-09]ALL82451.1 cobalamin biosynthesis protein CobW [Pseudonocardia sp. EC080619-01]
MTELVVLCGTVRDGVERTIGRMRELDPGVVVLHHELHDLGRGRVHRRLRRGADDERTVLELAHGCVSCTIREDVLPTLAALTGTVDRVVLHLDPRLEPEPVCWALGAVLFEPGDGRAACTAADLVDLRGVVAVLDTDTWLDDATGDATLPERGLSTLPDDERTVAQLAVGQAEFADVVVTAGGPATGRTAAVLDRLAPTAPRLTADTADHRLFCDGLAPDARRGVPGGVHDPLLRGTPPLEESGGVRTLLFSERRPFHPDRLHDAIDTLLDGVVRTRGRVWLATRPDAVLWLESAGGGLRIGHAGDWLDGADEQAWAEAGDQRRAMAALSWHPRWGDRAQDLVVLCHEADPDDVDAALRLALLTDAEIAAGEAAWAELPDPFGWAHDEPCADPEPARSDPTTGTDREGEH